LPPDMLEAIMSLKIYRGSTGINWRLQMIT